jgi:subtilisin family serine protease
MKKKENFGLRLLSAIFVVSILFIAWSGNTWAGNGNNDWMPDQLLVQPRAGAPPEVLSTIFAEHGADILDFIPQVNTIVLRVPPDKIETVQNALSRSPHFKSISKDYLRYQHSTTPNDYWYIGQWHLPKIQASEAWGITVGEENVVIAVVDGGIAAVPDLAQKLLQGINIIEGGTDTTGGSGHGTAVAGVSAAITNNSIGVASIAWLNKILPVKVYSATGSTTCSAITKGIVWAADHGAKVINMSFGGPSPCNGDKSAVDYAWGKGAVLVASAGNDSSTTPNYPAAYSNVMAVAATDPNDSLSSFSSYGSWLSVAAPGNYIVTTLSNGFYAGFSGTSAAAPVVSGIAGLVLSANPALSNSQVKSIIEKNADDLGAPGFDIYYGWGRVNAYKAVLAAIGTAPPPPDTTPPTASIASPANGATISGSITVSVSASDNAGVTQVELYIDGVLFATDTTVPYSFAWDTTKTSDGIHTLQAVAYDAAGNSTASYTVSVTVNNFVSDTIPPSVAISIPTNGSTLSKVTKIKVKTSDNVQVQQVGVYLDGSRIGSAICSASSCSPSFNWNTSKISKGMHGLSADAYDATGNRGVSSSVTVYK